MRFDDELTKGPWTPDEVGARLTRLRVFSAKAARLAG